MNELLSGRREKIDAAFRRKFGPGVTRVLATEAAEWQREIFERVRVRMLAATPDVAALIAKGEPEKVGETLAAAFEAALNEELSS